MKVVAEITMSLDGFVAGPNVGVDNPLGQEGERLHDWLFQGATEIDRRVAEEYFASTGAFVMGRRTFDLGLEHWGADGAFRRPCFVLTHRPRPQLVKGKTTFTFVTDGIDSALEQARAATGDKDVLVMGGAAVIQQYLKAGQVDELRIHIASMLLGAGTRLFENIGSELVVLERTRVLESPHATHLIYRIVR